MKKFALVTTLCLGLTYCAAIKPHLQTAKDFLAQACEEFVKLEGFISPSVPGFQAALLGCMAAPPASVAAVVGHMSAEAGVPQDVVEKVVSGEE